MNKLDYTGKLVFIGIDVHLRQYTVCCRCEGAVVKRASMVGNPGDLLGFIINHFKGATVKTVYEAGLSGFVLHRVLDGAEIENVVVHAASIEVSRKKSKTDKRGGAPCATGCVVRIGTIGERAPFSKHEELVRREGIEPTTR